MSGMLSIQIGRPSIITELHRMLGRTGRDVGLCPSIGVGAVMITFDLPRYTNCLESRQPGIRKNPVSDDILMELVWN